MFTEKRYSQAALYTGCMVRVDNWTEVAITNVFGLLLIEMLRRFIESPSPNGWQLSSTLPLVGFLPCPPAQLNVSPYNIVLRAQRKCIIMQTTLRKKNTCLGLIIIHRVL